jgi:hypothetical protein
MLWICDIPWAINRAPWACERGVVPKGVRRRGKGVVAQMGIGEGDSDLIGSVIVSVVVVVAVAIAIEIMIWMS